MRRIGALAFLMLLFGLLAGAGRIQANEQVLSSSSVEKLCRLGGLRYFGKTAQNLKLCFTLARDQKRMVEFGFFFRSKCPSAVVIAPGSIWRRLDLAPIKGLPLGTDGRFSLSGLDVTFKGTVKGTKAIGTLRRVGDQGCDTGIVRWDAHRT